MLAQGLGLVAAFGVLIALPQTAAEGVRSGLTLCGQVILPSLFPFFVCSNLFVLLGFSARVSARFGGLAGFTINPEQITERGERVRDRDDGRLPRRGAGRGASV